MKSVNDGYNQTVSTVTLHTPEELTQGRNSLAEELNLTQATIREEAVRTRLENEAKKKRRKGRSKKKFEAGQRVIILNKKPTRRPLAKRFDEEGVIQAITIDKQAVIRKKNGGVTTRRFEHLRLLE